MPAAGRVEGENMVTRRMTSWLAIVGALAIVLTQLAPATTAAQGGDTWQLSNGQTLAWTDVYELDQEYLYVDDGFEILALLSPTGIVRVISTSFAASGTEVRNIAVEDLEASVPLRQVDRGDYDNVSYSLDTTSLEGMEIGIFTLVIESPASTLLTMLISPIDVFQYEMEVAQTDVTIGGEGLFDGVDATVMQQHLTNATGVALAQDSDPTPTTVPPTPVPPTPTPEPVVPTPTPAAPQPTQSAGSGSLIDDLNLGLGGDQPTPADEGGQTTPDITGAGSNSVVIAESGVEVGYTDAWKIDTEDPGRIQLFSTGAPWMVAAFLNLDGALPMGGSMQLAEVLLDTPELEAPEIVDARDLDNGRKLIVIVDRAATGDVYMIYDITPAASTTTAFLLVVDAPSLATGVDIAQTTLSIDGQPVLPGVQQVIPAIFTPSS